MKTLRTAVIGVGYLGQFHAEKYKILAHSDLVAVCDIDPERANTIGLQYKVPALYDYKELVGKVDAVSIAVPTPLHYQTALFFLKNRIHVLIEKPITNTLAEAEELIAVAKEQQVILQVGHLERFNNAIKAIEPLISQPRFIESLRLAPFSLRGSDVNVILDLMIHDIDIIQSLVKAELKHISACGAPVLSHSVDIANARLEFANGCIANVTASRINLKKERRLRIFQSDSYISLDLELKKLTMHRKGEQEMFPGIPEIIRQNQVFTKGDALKEQIEAFLKSIIYNIPPLVSGEKGKEALATAIKINQTLQNFIELYPIY